MLRLPDGDLDLGGGGDRTVVVEMVMTDGGDDLLDFLGDRRGDVCYGGGSGELFVGPARGEAEREEEEEEDDGGSHEDSDDYPQSEAED